MEAARTMLEASKQASKQVITLPTFQKQKPWSAPAQVGAVDRGFFALAGKNARRTTTFEHGGNSE
jgi:hypothetical protein